jgi:hypothetical protein
VATGNGDVVVISSGGLIVRANALAVATRLLSVTWMVKFDVLAVVGWPLMTPVAAFNVRPPGKDPTLTAQLYCPLPPVAVTVCA